MVNDIRQMIKNDQESDLEFVYRVCCEKQTAGWTWSQVQQFLNDSLGYSYSAKWYSKHYNNGDFSPLDVHCDGDCGDCDNFVDCFDAYAEDVYNRSVAVEKKEKQLKKDRMKIAEEISCNNALIRRLSREESIIEIAKDYASKMSKSVRLLGLREGLHKVKNNGKNEGILLLSDWHYGMVCDNYWNTYNPDICKQRVNDLLARVIDIIVASQLKAVTVLNLSDLIAGRIHSQIRIESRFDVITQVMDVAEILAEFLHTLAQFCEVRYYDCLDNHSRLEPNKKESMDLESLVRIIPWYLKERLQDIPNISIYNNEFGLDIITCEVLGHKIVGVHGDNDNPKNALDRLSMMTHNHYAMLCTAHLHHFSMDEQNQSLVVSNSSLMGVDRYSEKLRLTSDPSQTLVIASEENVCECVYRIRLS